MVSAFKLFLITLEEIVKTRYFDQNSPTVRHASDAALKEILALMNNLLKNRTIVNKLESKRFKEFYTYCHFDSNLSELITFWKKNLIPPYSYSYQHKIIKSECKYTTEYKDLKYSLLALAEVISQDYGLKRQINDYLLFRKLTEQISALKEKLPPNKLLASNDFKNQHGMQRPTSGVHGDARQRTGEISQYKSTKETSSQTVPQVATTPTEGWFSVRQRTGWNSQYKCTKETSNQTVSNVLVNTGTGPPDGWISACDNCGWSSQDKKCYKERHGIAIQTETEEAECKVLDPKPGLDVQNSALNSQHQGSQGTSDTASPPRELTGEEFYNPKTAAAIPCANYLSGLLSFFWLKWILQKKETEQLSETISHTEPTANITPLSGSSSGTLAIPGSTSILEKNKETGRLAAESNEADITTLSRTFKFPEGKKDDAIPGNTLPLQKNKDKEKLTAETNQANNVTLSRTSKLPEVKDDAILGSTLPLEKNKDKGRLTAGTTQADNAFTNRTSKYPEVVKKDGVSAILGSTYILEKDKDKRRPTGETNQVDNVTLNRASKLSDVKKDDGIKKPEKGINILILGETGVGKSTWINGIVNYFSFATLEEAELQEEIRYAIPTSFSVTNEDYEEEVITIGKDQNETYDVGKSSTQDPKTYTFYRGDTLVRLIDTPGVGDTRGIAQDSVKSSTMY